MPVSPRASELLRFVHAEPSTTRADAARAIGIGTGAATEAVAQLVDAGLIAERPAERTGGRGRPTTVLLPHDDGPLVLAASITQEDWRLHAVELGGGTVAEAAGEHAGADGPDALAEVAHAVGLLRRRFGARIRGIAAAAPGTVSGTRVLHATERSWRDLELRVLWPRAEVFVVGNDATLAAAAESSRGAAAGADVALHLRIVAGIGGAVVDHGRVLTGAHGFGGEFGHMPFGDSAVRCACGAYGCWGTAVDGGALARALGRRAPRDPVAYSARLIAVADRDPEATAVDTVADAFGRGLAGLVNAVDPDCITLGGVGRDLLAARADRIDTALRAGLLRTHRDDPPPVVAAELGEDGPLVGAAEQAWDAVWPLL